MYSCWLELLSFENHSYLMTNHTKENHNLLLKSNNLFVFQEARAIIIIIIWVYTVPLMSMTRQIRKSNASLTGMEG